MTDEVLGFVLERMRDEPGLNSATAAKLIEERFDLVVHPRSIERAIERKKKKR